MYLLVKEKDGDCALVNCDKIYSVKFSKDVDGSNLMIFKSSDECRVEALRILSAFESDTVFTSNRHFLRTHGIEI
jgi:hypothetical protein